MHLVFDLLQPTESGEGRLVDRRSGFEVNVLVQQAQFHSARAHNVATVRRFITSNKPKDRAFAGAVPAYQSHVFAGIYLQGRASQDILNTVRLMNI
jgi:hypothetical protein